MIDEAVARSAATAAVRLGNGVIAEAGVLLKHHFGDRPVRVVCDGNTRKAGAALFDALDAAGIAHTTHLLPATPRPKPSVDLGEAIAAEMGEATPVSLGSGVINDVTKYAAHTLDRPYLCVATAASMDGYTSAGAPLTRDGFKKTIDCRSPLVILADLDIVAAAPAQMSGWGYGDLAGKVPAGGDWIIADALGIEPIDDVAWPLVQDNLAGWLAAPDKVRAGEPAAIADLFGGLTLAGFAMEFHGTSRPASGADHQIAHIWEMESLMHEGERVSHGACVSLGTLTSLRLLDFVLAQDLSALDAEAVLASAPTLDDKKAAIAAAFPPALAERALQETAAKHAAPDVHRARLATIAAVWPSLKARLETHLMRAPMMRGLLERAGAPVEPQDIGITQARLVATVRAGRFIRSRYTVLDLLEETGLFDKALDTALGN
ncbi:MAG: hypothetical protein AcusKO_36850 [Acuticoccus sp.]